MKTTLITGANSGIGLATAKALAQQQHNLILLCRSEAKGKVAQAELQALNPAIRVELIVADLGSAASVRQVADQIRATHTQLDRLINNAGYSPDTIEYTSDGIEKSFYANHIGHFVLTYHLLDLLKATPDARIINVSSSAYALGKAGRFFKRVDGVSTLGAYGDGKLANVLFTKALVNELAGTSVGAYSVHPGVVSTNFGSNFTGFSGRLVKLFRPLMRTAEKGARSSVFLATAPVSELQPGGFYVDSKPKAIKHKDWTDEAAAALWEQSMAFS